MVLPTSGLSRRHLLTALSVAALVSPALRALAQDTPRLEGPPRKVTLAWMPTALCMIAVPVADK